MENNENLVLNGTENVEATTTEEIVEQVTEPELIYSEADFKQKFDAGVKKKLARKEAQIRKKYEDRYGRLESVLRAGLGKNTIEEITDELEGFYRKRGVDIPQKPTYSDRDAEILAGVEADEIIKLGFEDVVEEADRLNEIGYENMTARDKALFVKLTNHIKNTESSRELSKIGVTEDVYNSSEFKSFASKFNSDTPITEIYNIFNQTKSNKNIKPMGSIKNATKDDGIKAFYTPEEARRFTVEDFDRTPGLLAAVEDSMKKWRK